MSEESAEILTEEILLERDATIMTDEISAAKDDIELGDEIHNDIEKPEENPSGDNKDKVDDDKATDKPEEKVKPRQSGFEKRIGRATKKLREAERSLVSVQQENQALRDKLDTDIKPAQKTKDAPEEEEFDTYTEFVDALTKHNIKQALQSETKTETESSQEAKPAENIRNENIVPEVDAVIGDIMNDGADKYTDYDEVVRNPKVNISNEILVNVVDTNTPDDLLYYLGKNPSEADRLNDLNNKAMAREIEKINAKLESGEINFEPEGSDIITSGDEAEDKPRQKRTTSAPRPTKSIDGEGSHSSKSIDKMTTAEYRKYRHSQEMSKRGYAQ